MTKRATGYTKYYEDFLRYHALAKIQQAECNLGSVPYAESTVNDDLMKAVELYDTVNRKYAGFSAILNDCFYGWTPDHPYWSKMESNRASWQRETVSRSWTGKREAFGLPEWLYVFILHRVCGSGIHYGKRPSGYHNTILFDLHACSSIGEMAEFVNSYPGPFYTSIGYQFPAFPKPEEGYRRGGDFFLCKFAPRLSLDFAEFLSTGPKKTMREAGQFMFDWNSRNGLRIYRFQYSAVLSDVADWFPDLIDGYSLFYYGSNARKCMSYLVEPFESVKDEKTLDELTESLVRDTGEKPYDLEDVGCDYQRYVCNYVRPGGDYDAVDLDAVWNSSAIRDHPYGRQKAMLDAGLVKTFNGRGYPLQDDTIIREAGLSVDQYREMVRHS